MTDIQKYTFQQITDISFSGFIYTIPEDTITMINHLCSNVGSECLNANVFQKKELSRVPDAVSSSFKQNNKKRRGNKSMEVTSEDWETVRTFQTTKIEQKSGIDGEIDKFRLLLNKLTDKTFLDIREKIIAKLNEISDFNPSPEDKYKMATMIFEISSTNKFYSKIFADLYAELTSMYDWLRPVFHEKFTNIMEQYQNIQYVDPETNYDGFCDMNKQNEKRKAVTTFFVNLAINGFISSKSIIGVLANLLSIVSDLIVISEKKNEVDELTENIAILFNKEIIDRVDDMTEFNIGKKTILEIVNALAKSKVKDFPSLSNKSIFKYMDLVEM